MATVYELYNDRRRERSDGYGRKEDKEKPTIETKAITKRKETVNIVVDETTSNVNGNTNCINPMLKALLQKARDCNVEVCEETKPEPDKVPTERDEDNPAVKKAIDRAVAVGADPRIIASIPAIVAGLKLLEKQEKNALNYQPQSINMKMAELKYKLRQTLKKTPKKNQKIIDFVHCISATPQSANSFKHIYVMNRSEDKETPPKLMLFYNQSVNLDIGTNPNTAKVGFEDIRTITFHTYLDWYITKNSFVGNIRTTKNLFSFDNIVIDVDNHSDIGKKALRKEIRKLVACLQSKDLDFPEFNVVYTGRGVHIWIGLVSFTARKGIMQRLYTTFCEKLCDIVKKVIQDNNISLDLDEGASKDMCRFVRLPYTTNTKTNNKRTMFKKLTDRRYTVDELCQRFDMKRANNDEKKETQTTPKKSGINYNIDFSSLLIKRMNFIEKIVADCNGNCIGRRELLLHHYFNVCQQIFSEEKAIEMTEQLNVQFSEPLQSSALQAIFREKIYAYKSSSFLSGINATFEERKLYLSTTGRQSERDKAKKAKEERNQKIVELRKNGFTQQQIADEVGCHVDTVANVLKKYKPEIKQETAENTGDIKKLKLIKPMRKDVEELTIKLYKQGYKQKEVAKKLGVAESTVSDILKPYKSKKSERNQTIIELSQQGYTQQQIADMVDCGKSTVIRVLNAYKKNKSDDVVNAPAPKSKKPVKVVPARLKAPPLISKEQLNKLPKDEREVFIKLLNTSLTEAEAEEHQSG